MIEITERRKIACSRANLLLGTNGSQFAITFLVKVWSTEQNEANKRIGRDGLMHDPMNFCSRKYEVCASPSRQFTSSHRMILAAGVFSQPYQPFHPPSGSKPSNTWLKIFDGKGTHNVHTPKPSPSSDGRNIKPSLSKSMPP